MLEIILARSVGFHQDRLEEEDSDAAVGEHSVISLTEARQRFSW